MTTIGPGRALPYLIPEFWTATLTALIVVFIELSAIVRVQSRYMETPFFRATFQVVLGGALVLAAGILSGTRTSTQRRRSNIASANGLRHKPFQHAVFGPA
jgi:hypothetical protein